MGLRDTIKNLTNTAITKQIGDLKATITFTSVVSVYDPESGTVTATSTNYTCEGLLTNLDQKNIADMSVVATGRRLLVPSAQLDGVNVDALDDKVVVNGVSWTIDDVKLDPSGSLYTFIVIASSGMQVNAATR